MTRGSLTVEFDDEPRILSNRAGTGVAVDATIRVFDTRGRELRIDPHRICVNPPILVPDGTFTTTKRLLHGREIEMKVPNLVEDPEEAYLSWLFDSIQQTPAAKGFRTRGTVTTFYANTDDGWMDSSDASFATARAGSGSFYVGDVSEDLAVGNTTSAGVFFLDQGYIRFDTSSIGDSDSIDAVELSLFQVNHDYNWAVGNHEARSGYTWSGSGVTSADWQDGTEYGALTLCATSAAGSMGSDSTYYAYTESGTNFRSAINKTGYTELVLCVSTFASGTAATDLGYGIFRRADNTGTTQDPKLVVTHTAAAAGGSAALRPNRAFRVWNRRSI